jgi:hypothetical protein
MMVLDLHGNILAPKIDRSQTDWPKSKNSAESTKRKIFRPKLTKIKKFGPQSTEIKNFAQNRPKSKFWPKIGQNQNFRPTSTNAIMCSLD